MFGIRRGSRSDRGFQRSGLFAPSLRAQAKQSRKRQKPLRASPVGLPGTPSKDPPQETSGGSLLWPDLTAVLCRVAERGHDRRNRRLADAGGFFAVPTGQWIALE